MEYFIFLDGNFIPHSFITVLPTYQRGYLRETAEDFVKGGRKTKIPFPWTDRIKAADQTLESQFSRNSCGIKIARASP